MIPSYNPATLEPSILQAWESANLFQADPNAQGEKYYCLAMFPYPSGSLHMGHVRNYTLGDAFSRFHRMLGKNVLQPMGWDAFGLPAENAAIQHKMSPSVWTDQNIAHMKQELKRLGFAYDFSRELKTCDPDYYRWEQWFFIQLYQKGLVFKKNATVNWDPVDQTVLANEQVIDGRGWRSGALVEQKSISQWFIRITDYADELLDSIDSLTGWPEAVKQMQRNWIGRSEGAEINFQVEHQTETLLVYTTRADTLMGVTYLSISPSHPLINLIDDQALLNQIQALQIGTVSEASRELTEKTGVATGLFAIHPITHERLPIWAANFVLMDYGTGAVMCTPAHDVRDFEFAKRYELPILAVIADPKNASSDLPLTTDGFLIHSGIYNDLTSKKARTKIVQDLIKEKSAKACTHYRLRDWGVSRQRYWGTPIPMIHCPSCGIVPEKISNLPVLLPIENFQLEGTGSPLSRHPEFLATECPQCGSPSQRETDTFDTFFESSWYFARFCCPNAQSMIDDEAAYWMPVDQYIGGIEHAILHLLYARFFHKLLCDVLPVKMPSREPFKHLLTQGMVLKDGHKMSKSKGNTVSPQQMIERYGADTIRLFVLFAAPPEQSLEWSEGGVEGSYRFLKRLWRLTHDYRARFSVLAIESIEHVLLNDSQKALRQALHGCIQKVYDDIARRQLFNTAIASIMTFINHLAKFSIQDQNDQKVFQEALLAIIQMLAPLTPFISQSLWETMGQKGFIMHASFPQCDSEALIQETLTLVVQVNGKLRGKITIKPDQDQALIEKQALETPQIQEFVQDKAIKRIIYVPKKLLNIVVI